MLRLATTFPFSKKSKWSLQNQRFITSQPGVSRITNLVPSPLIWSRKQMIYCLFLKILISMWSWTILTPFSKILSLIMLLSKRSSCATALVRSFLVTSRKSWKSGTVFIGAFSERVILKTGKISKRHATLWKGQTTPTTKYNKINATQNRFGKS